jgi:hypothetical protein
MCCPFAGLEPEPAQFLRPPGRRLLHHKLRRGPAHINGLFFPRRGAPGANSAPFGPLFYVKTIILPRQARDKHRES